MNAIESACAGGAAAVMSSARELSYVDDVTIFGNALHLLLRSGVDDPTVERDLSRASGSPVSVRPIAPSLEDVFVRLTRIQQLAATHGNGGVTAGATGGDR